MTGFTTNELLYPLTKGDSPGHPFRGNQYEDGEGGHDDDGHEPADAMEDRLGRCYELAGKYASMMRNSTLVHGSIQGFGNPRIGHAWVQLKNGDIWEPITNQVYPKQVFDAFFNAKVLKTYTHDEVLKKTLEFGHWGPWDKEADADKRGIVPPIR